jgi:DNA-binding transcriptional ArsR family regulator
MPKLGCINITRPARLTAGTESIRNVINSLLLIAECNDFPGVSPFITRTHAAMAREVRKLNEVFMVGLQYAAFPVNDFSSFEDYLDDLKRTDPLVLQERVFHSYDLISGYKVGIMADGNPITVTRKDQERLLASKQIYLDYLTRSFGSEELNYDIEGRAYEYLADPETLRSTMVEHLQYMWTYFLKDEFIKNQAALEKTVIDLNQINTASMSPLKAVEKITGHDMEREWAGRQWELEWLHKADRVVFIPSFHMGPYLGRRVLKDAMYIFFSPKITEGMALSSPDLTRADIHTRLATLGDDIRLQMLKALTRHAELSSKQIMDGLNLSQSSASRHLKQLSATGFINEHRQNSAKIYSLNTPFISRTLEAVSNYLSMNR